MTWMTIGVNPSLLFYLVMMVSHPKEQAGIDIRLYAMEVLIVRLLSVMMV